MKNKFFILTVAILAIALSSFGQETGTFTDSRDGKQYKTIKIGTQIWMAENLAYEAPECKFYDNDHRNIETYGCLYNFYLAQISCPNGWHLPTDEEWTKLVDFLGGFLVAGGKMKAVDSIHWENPNIGANNESGFSALPGGAYCYQKFIGIESFGMWWSASLLSNSMAWEYDIRSETPKVIRNCGLHPQGSALSVRCVKN
ncbi:MAG: FISUMP domain-containing protein [Saprospiraceae bacterium]